MHVDVYRGYARAPLYDLSVAWFGKKMTLWHLHKAASGKATFDININKINIMLSC